MEVVFKLSRAEIELACAQYLAAGDVRFEATPKLAPLPGHDFEHLCFSARIAVRAPAAPLLALRSAPAAAPAAAPDEASVDEVTAPRSATRVLAPGAHQQVRVVEGSSEFGAPPAAGAKRAVETLGTLMSGDAPPSAVKLPPSVLAHRASSS